MKEIEARLAVGGDAVPAVQLVDAASGGGQQGVVARRVLLGGVGPVRQQREAQLAVSVGQVVDVQALDLFGDLSLAREQRRDRDRKSTRLNSSHLGISYAVFCLKKKI